MRTAAYRIPRSFLIALALIASLPAAARSDKSYYYPEIRMTVTLEPDGTADIDEVRTYRFDGSFSWATLRKETGGQYGRYQIEYLGVSDVDTGERFRSEVSREDGLEVLKWYYTARDETRRFRIRYRVHGAVQRYGDAAQFYWKLIAADHEPIERFSVTLLPPAPSLSLMKVFVHGPTIGNLDIADDRTRADIQVENIPRGRFVEVRALLDPAVFTAVPVLSGQSHASLLEDERRTTEQWRLAQQRRIERSRRRARELIAALILGGASALVLIAVYIRYFREYGREFDVGYVDRYERQPPRDLPPCYLPAIMTQSGMKTEMMGRAFIAAILECARLGCLEIREFEKGALIFKKKELEYELTELGRRVLSGSDEGLPRPLVFFERDVLRALFTEAGDGSKVTGEEIRKWAVKKSGPRTKFYKFVEKRGKRLRRDFESRYFRLDDQVSERAKKRFFGIAALIGVVPAAVFLAVTRNPIIIPFAILIIVAGAVLTIPLARWTREANLEHAKWTSFRRFMTDFSAMKEAGPSLLPLWEQFLVYAAALGVTAKLLKNLEQLAREYDMAVPVVLWFHPAAGTAGPAAGAAAFDSVGASIANLSALSSALSTTTSSGGGFSGGGGGGGGGGGSGAG